MSALTPVSNNIIPSQFARRIRSVDGVSPTIASAAFNAGQLAYKQADFKFGVASALGVDPICRPAGMFENSGGANQACSIIWYDPDLNIGAAVVGVTYILGLAGALNPTTDVAAGWQVSPVATGKSATNICLYCPMGAPESLTNPTPPHA